MLENENDTSLESNITDVDIKELEKKKLELEAKIEEALLEQKALDNELNNAVAETFKISANALDISKNIGSNFDQTGKSIKEISDYTLSLFHIVDELTLSYFSLKNISAASKSITEYTQIYNSKFSFNNELRRIALGYVVGVDSYVIHNESLRSKVEKNVLQNSKYWLSYALSSVMLWVSNEKDAANRAVQKALDIDYDKACLYYLLINLRFQRIDAARKWFFKYLERFDISDVKEEWGYLLEAYLHNCFGKSSDFSKQVDTKLSEIIDKVKIINIGFERKVSNYFMEYMKTYPHNTKREFTNIKRYCKNHDQMLRLLSYAENNYYVANYFNEISLMNDHHTTDLQRKIENTLYNLINSYDDSEYEIYKKIKYYEGIVNAKGDITLASKNYELVYGEKENVGLDEFLMRLALSDKDSNIDIRLRLFAFDYLNDSFIQGAKLYNDFYHKQFKNEFEIAIDDCYITYEIDKKDDCYNAFNKHYSKNLFWYIFDDRFIVIFLMLTIASLATLSILPFYFDLTALIIGASSFVVFGFLSLFNIFRKKKVFNNRKQKYFNMLKDTLREIDDWYDYYQAEDKKQEVLLATIKRFNSEGEITK